LRALAIHIDPYVWLVIAFSLFAVLPLAGPDYFFDAHDAPHSVFFLTQFDAAIRDGVWYPGWGTDHALGYGYPTFVYYPPLAYYAAEAVLLLGAGAVAAVKWTWALATIGAGLAMYAFGRHILGRQRGLLMAIVYTYAPYHLVDIYVRAALAEYCAFVWMPLALLAFHRLTEEVTASRAAWAGLAYGALWLTHNVTGLAFTPLLACYVLYRLLAKRASWRARLGPAAAALGAAMLGLGIAASLLLPNLLERVYINREQWVRAGYGYAQHFVYPFQLVSPFWGHGAAGPGPVDGMSFQLGAVPLVLSVVATVKALFQPSRNRGWALFFAAATLVLIALMLPVSAALWELLPLAALVQFPWRLLALSTVTLAALSGFAVPRVRGSGLDARVLVLCLVAILASFTYTLPEYTPVQEGTEESQLTPLAFETEYPDMVGMVAWTKEQASSSPLVSQYLAGGDLVTAEVLAPDASLDMVRAGGASDEVTVRSEGGTALRFYTYYFPGWRVFVDGQRLPDSELRPETEYGLLTVDIPPGEHHVLLRWGDTPVRLAGKAISLACLALTLCLLVPWPRLGKSSKK
jgi:hypothetical protein